MTRRNLFGSVGALGIAVLSASAQAEDARLGPMAEVLMNRVGRWNVEMRLDPGQGRGAIVSKAVETNHLVGGKWLVSELSGEMNGRPFTGLGLNGYDNASGKYVGTWCDSHSAGIQPVEGTYDAKSRSVATISNERSGMRVSGITRTVDADTEETTLVTQDPDGSTISRMVMHLTRAK